MEFIKYKNKKISITGTDILFNIKIILNRCNKYWILLQLNWYSECVYLFIILTYVDNFYADIIEFLCILVYVRIVSYKKNVIQVLFLTSSLFCSIGTSYLHTFY